jgi:hypothetical protein
MSLGDASSDGYPDLLTLFRDELERHEAPTYSINELCAVDDLNCSSFNEEFTKGYAGKLRNP